MTWQTKEQAKNCAHLISAGGFAFTESKLSSCVLLLRVPMEKTLQSTNHG